MEKTRDLEKRTMEFAQNTIRLCKELPKNVVTIELIKQVVRSSCSVGANYREANEKLGKKDFVHRIRIARKEAKETTYWLVLIEEVVPEFSERIRILVQESEELRNIFSAILNKTA